MPYAEDGSDVPEAIGKLPAKRRRQFAKVWNSVYEETGDEGRAFAAANAAMKEEQKMTQAEKTTMVYAPITKVEQGDDGSAFVYGKVGDENVDLSKQITDLGWLSEALPEWHRDWGNVREMHQPSAVGVSKSLDAEDDGFYLGAKIVDADAARKCVEGVYKGFSIGIKAPVIVADPLARGGRIKGGKIVEVSIVDHPANENTKFVLAKGADIDAALAAQADATKQGEADHVAIAKQIMDLIKQLIAAEVAEPDGAESWTIRCLCEALDFMGSFASAESYDAAREMLGLAADVDLAKAAAGFAAKNKAALQTLHDAIAKMAPDVCNGGEGADNVEKQAIIELIRSEVPELLKAATPDDGTEALTEKVGNLEAEVGKVAGLEADVTTLKEQVEEISKRATPGGPYVGGALPRPQDGQEGMTPDPMRAEMTKLAESEKPEVRANAQEWLRLHPAS